MSSNADPLRVLWRSLRLYVLCMFGQASTALASEPPLDYLHTNGPAADPVAHLAWGLGAISVLVTVVVTGLLVGAIWHKRTPSDAPKGDIRPRNNGLAFVYIGVGISIVILFACTAWTIETLAGVARPAAADRMTIEITGHQWWWEVRYLSPNSEDVFLTANELHIPIDTPVHLVLYGGDVIHSFWVPKLAGKTDTIPGQTNDAWIEATTPGVYRGQCTEYCGLQHAHMGVRVVAESPTEFAAWRAHQIAPATASTSVQGERLFVAHCGACHTARGLKAGGLVGPDLTHVASRQMIAADMLYNNRENLRRWISDAPREKPGTQMPNMNLSAQDLDALTDFVVTLR